MNFRFAIISDLHIAVPHTIWDHPGRFHLVEVSIPALEIILKHLDELKLDFLLLPGDLTQHGEPENHSWLQKRLELLPYPVYVVPGNHDVPHLLPTERSIGVQDFPYYYEKFGYKNPNKLYYSCEIVPGVQLIGLNSNQFDVEGKQLGCLDDEQLSWLKETLPKLKDKLVLVMIHHNVLEHLPGQSRHDLGRRYMLDNGSVLKQILGEFGVKLIFTGHLHVQDVAVEEGLVEVTTGSIVSYPHPYRVLEYETNAEGRGELRIESYRVKAVRGWENLLESSRLWMGDRSLPFMMRLLTSHPLNLSVEEAQKFAPHLRYFWADIAEGDALFDFPLFPDELRRHFWKFGAIAADGTPALIDNCATILI